MKTNSLESLFKGRKVFLVGFIYHVPKADGLTRIEYCKEIDLDSTSEY